MTMSGIIQPTATHQIANGKVEILCFGKNTGSWKPNLHLVGTDNLHMCNETDNWSCCLVSKLRNYLDGIKKIWVPSPRLFTGRIDERQNWPTAIPCFGTTSPLIAFGQTTEGIKLEPSEAILIGTADCTVITIHNRITGFTASAHGGLNSLVDRARIRTGVASRPNDSVVDHLIEIMGSERKNLEILISCSIGPKYFLHEQEKNEHINEKEAKDNELLIKYIGSNWGNVCLGPDPLGQINLANLIIEQFDRHGVDRSAISHDGADTYSDVDKSGNHLWWSHRRFTDNGKSGIDGRNGTLIKRLR